MCVCVWHWDNSHVTEHDPEVQPSDSQYGELNTAAASERKGSNCLQSNRFSVHLMSLINEAWFTLLCSGIGNNVPHIKNNTISV